MRILFVCSGNTCRSPMAEGYLNAKRIKSLTATSCGFISEGDSVSEKAEKAMSEIGIDISAHKSRLVSNELLCSDKIFCMGESHKRALLAAGVDSTKLYILGGGISDPFGSDIETYRKCRDEIIDAIDTALYGGEMLPIKVLPVEKTDIDDIAALEKQSFSSPWSENAICESMEHNTVFFKAICKNSFAGYIGITAVADQGYINNIAVKEEFKRNSVGSLLLDRAVTFAKSKSLEFLSLEVRFSNTPAISLYENAGFLRAGIRKNFYDHPKEDGLIMTRRFNYDNTRG